MTWVKVDDTITEHPKFVGLSDAGWTLWIHGLAYAGRNLSDGLIPTGMLYRLSNTRQPGRAAAELVKAGLWDECPDGWIIHDYLEHQRSADSLDRHKKSSAKGAGKGNHTRWHIGKGITDPKCQWCVSESSVPLTAHRVGGESVNGQQSKREKEIERETDQVHRQLTVVASDVAAVVEESIQAIAAYEAVVAKGSGVQPDKGWVAYERGIANRVRRDDRDRLADQANAHPEWTAVQLRDWYLEPESFTSYGQLVPGIGGSQ